MYDLDNPLDPVGYRLLPLVALQCSRLRLSFDGQRLTGLPHNSTLTKYAGLDPGAIEVVPPLEQALDRGLELTPPGGELVLLPTYTAMLALRKIVARRGFVRPYWERAA